MVVDDLSKVPFHDKLTHYTSYRLEAAELKMEAQEREAKLVRRQEITLQVRHVTHGTMSG